MLQPPPLFIDTAASDAFAQQLQSVDMNRLALSDYDRRYLAHLLDHARYYCRIYAMLLNRAVAISGLPPGKLVLLDYGAGNGLMGMMARACGIGKVYINDHNPVFVQAASALSNALRLPIDGFPEGDICTDPAPFARLGLNAVVGFDVIEHVYDLRLFFRSLSALHPNIIMVMGTGANIHHPLKAREFRNLQYRDEHLGGSPDDFSLYGATPQQAFIRQRAELIEYAFPSLPKQAQEGLAKATRGLSGKELMQAVERFVNENVLPVPPKDASNTCDPVSGSWTERLLPISEYRRLVEEAGLSFSFECGFYNTFGNGFKYRLRGVLNRLIPLLGKRLAPFLVFTAKGRGK